MTEIQKTRLEKERTERLEQLGNYSDSVLKYHYSVKETDSNYELYPTEKEIFKELEKKAREEILSGAEPYEALKDIEIMHSYFKKMHKEDIEKARTRFKELSAEAWARTEAEK